MHQGRVQPQELRPAAHGGALRGLALVLAHAYDRCDLVGAEAVSIYNEAAPAPSSVRPQVRDAPSLPLRGLIGQLLCSPKGHGQGVCDGR